MKQLHALIMAALVTAAAFMLISCNQPSGQVAQAPKTLSMETAQSTIEAMSPGAVVNAVAPTPIEGLWEVVVTYEGKKGVAYMDVTAQYLVLGSIIDFKSQVNLTEQRYQELSSIEPKNIPLGDALVIGRKDSKNRVIVFVDPDCEACGVLHTEMKKAVTLDESIVFFLKIVPLVDIHPGAYDKTRTILCAKDNATSLALLEQSFEGKALPAPGCETPDVDENMALIHELGIRGTPTIIFDDGTTVSGVLQAEHFVALFNVGADFDPEGATNSPAAR